MSADTELELLYSRRRRRRRIRSDDVRLLRGIGQGFERHEIP